MPRDVTRHIPTSVQVLLWGRAAGRCEFAGHNKPLWRSSVTQEQVGIAQKAHIYAFGESGPRANPDVPDREVNSLTNLMLVCHECHRKIDEAPERYSAELLQRMKRAHEERIEVVTGIDPSLSSHVVLYGTNVGDQSSPLTFDHAANALFPARYPAAADAIQLSMVDGAYRDRDEEFWIAERDNLVRKFESRVRERLQTGKVSHLSIFALAPQPLLTLLGTLLTDLPDVDVYQLHREPRGWAWPPVAESGAHVEFRVDEPSCPTGNPALVISVSATIVDERARVAIDGDAAIWRVSVPSPNNDVIRTQEDLVAFRRTMRPLMDRIKSAHGEDAVLHVFTAAPVSIAVELGRIRMPKADLPFRIYDQNRELGGFVPAIDIGGER